ncbi:glycosyltransferase [Photobacterium leiognathi]|uniref:glycosyltransferase n=1 Tax=Photobacterium leiognathi TaxID=553611 RepID=UPI002981E8ED|nr:glycosyltransferase [Photobacterium leiognathi]
MNKNNKAILFIGFNDFRDFKRGVENVILSQVGAIENRDIYYIYNSKNCFEEYTYEGIKCIGVPGRMLRYVYPSILARKLKNKYKNVFIHSHNPLSSLFLLYKSDCLTVHDGLYYTRKYLRPKISYIFKLLEKLTYKKVKNIHYISNFTRSQMVSTSTKSTLIYNTTPIEKEIKKVKEIKPNKYLSSKGRNFFCVRGIQRRTRIDLLIDLAKENKKNKLEDKIFVAGKGELLEFYQNKIINEKLTEYIELLGFVADDELVNYYKFCDAVIVTAESGEGFGLPIIEGYLFNKPVFCSKVCAMPEVIIDKSYMFQNDGNAIFNCINRYNFNSEYYYSYYINNYSNKVIQEQYKNKIYKR